MAKSYKHKDKSADWLSIPSVAMKSPGVASMSIRGLSTPTSRAFMLFEVASLMSMIRESRNHLHASVSSVSIEDPVLGDAGRGVYNERMLIRSICSSVERYIEESQNFECHVDRDIPSRRTNTSGGLYVYTAKEMEALLTVLVKQLRG